MKPDYRAAAAERPGPSKPLPALEQRLTERLLAFERLDEAWPQGRTAVERAEIGRQREDALSEIVALRQHITTGHAETLADAAMQLRRLVVMAEETPRPYLAGIARRVRAGRLGAGGGRAGSGCGATYPQILKFPGAGII